MRDHIPGDDLTSSELEEALLVITSLLNKCVKSLEKLKLNSAQYTLLQRRIKALRLSVKLIEIEILKLS